MGNFLKKDLAQAIKKRQLTVASFERLAGLKKNIVQNILRGTSKNPSVKTLQAIANALNCKLSDLVEDKPHCDNSIDISSLKSKDLFIETTIFVTNYVSKNDSHIELNEFVETIFSIFNFCENKNNSKLDMNFAEWIVNEHFKKSRLEVKTDN